MKYKNWICPECWNLEKEYTTFCWKCHFEKTFLQWILTPDNPNFKFIIISLICLIISIILFITKHL